MKKNYVVIYYYTIGDSKKRNKAEFSFYGTKKEVEKAIKKDIMELEQLNEGIKMKVETVEAYQLAIVFAL